jgi:heme A synthase
MIAMMSRLARFAWTVLAYTIAVILWGAYVRATGAGAGCGGHWPLCNGVMVPRAPTVATLVEYSHRLTSGLALVSVLVLLGWTWARTPRAHPARLGAALTVFFMLTEAAVGAGLVLFELVADNASMARALFMAVHLLNTFILLASLTLTAWWLSGGAPIAIAGRASRASLVLGGCAGILLVGASGAVAALGDTLFHYGSLAEALGADVSPTAHLLIRLRLFHPAFALAVGGGLLFGAPRLAARRWNGRTVASLAALQLALGVANVALLAPVWLQLAHLLVADLLWIAFVLLGAAALEVRRPDLRVGRAETGAVV